MSTRLLYRRGTVIRYKAENTKSPVLRSIVLLSEDGTELLEIARTYEPRRPTQNTSCSDPPSNRVYSAGLTPWLFIFSQAASSNAS